MKRQLPPPRGWVARAALPFALGALLLLSAVLLSVSFLVRQQQQQPTSQVAAYGGGATYGASIDADASAAAAAAAYSSNTESLPGAPAFLVIGAAKSGTTSLWRYLLEHPLVNTPPGKEPRSWGGVKGGSFGGYTQSGNGREGGRHGLKEYMEVKTIVHA